MQPLEKSLETEKCITLLERCASSWRTPKVEDLKIAILAIETLSEKELTPEVQLRVWSLLTAISSKKKSWIRSIFPRDSVALATVRAQLQTKVEALVTQLTSDLSPKDVEQLDRVYKSLTQKPDKKTVKLTRIFYRALDPHFATMTPHGRTQDLYAAIDRTDLQAVEKLLLTGVSPNRHLYRSASPLNNALNKLIPPNPYDPNWEKAWKIVEALVRAGSKLDTAVLHQLGFHAPTSRGNIWQPFPGYPPQLSLLHLALVSGRETFVRELLHRGAPWRTDDRYGYTSRYNDFFDNAHLPVHLVIPGMTKGILSIYLRLAAEGKKLDVLGRMTDHRWALKPGSRDIVESFLAQEADLSISQLVALIPKDLLRHGPFREICLTLLGAEELRVAMWPHLDPFEKDHIIEGFSTQELGVKALMNSPVPITEAQLPLDPKKNYQFQFRDEKIEGGKVIQVPNEPERRQSWNALIQDSLYLRELVKDNPSEDLLPLPEIVTPKALRWILDHYAGKVNLTTALFDSNRKRHRQLRREIGLAINVLDLQSLEGALQPLDPSDEFWLITPRKSKQRSQ